MRTDADLLVAARTDAGAFRVLYDRYSARVLAYHRRRTGDEDTAMDLTAETFARAWFARCRFRDEVGGSAGPWVFAIARYVLLGSVRGRRLEQDACRRMDLETRGAAVEPEEHWLDGLEEALAEAARRTAGGDRAARPRRLDLGGRGGGARYHPRRQLAGGQARRRRRRLLAGSVTVATVALPAATVGAIGLLSEEEVARSLPAGIHALAGTEPTCRAVEAGVVYECELGRPPAPEVEDWTGAVEPTADASKHVNGGCRSHNAAGTSWRCYIGERAVEAGVIGPDLLGVYMPVPSRG